MVINYKILYYNLHLQWHHLCAKQAKENKKPKTTYHVIVSGLFPIPETLSFFSFHCWSDVVSSAQLFSQFIVHLLPRFTLN